MESYHTFSNEEKERRIKKIRYDFQDILLSQPPVSEKKITRVGTIIKPPPFPKSPAVIPAKQPAASKPKSKRKISKVHFL